MKRFRGDKKSEKKVKGVKDDPKRAKDILQVKFNLIENINGKKKEKKEKNIKDQTA